MNRTDHSRSYDEQGIAMRPRRSAKDIPAQASAAEQQEASAAAAEASLPAQPKNGIEDVQDQIRRLANLRQMGVLSDEEFSGLTAVLLDLP